MTKKTDTIVMLTSTNSSGSKDYATVLGTTVEIAVYEAVSDFIECCVSTRLESYQRKIHET
jgi:hypothetical protein